MKGTMQGTPLHKSRTAGLEELKSVSMKCPGGSAENTCVISRLLEVRIYEKSWDLHRDESGLFAKRLKMELEGEIPESTTGAYK